MKQKVMLQVRLMLVMLVLSCISVHTEGSDFIHNTPEKSRKNNNSVLSGQDLSVSEATGFLVATATQQPGDSLTKEEVKAIKKAERKEQRALARADKQANRKVIDNPNHADYILLGEDLPTGRGVLDAISGRVPGMMISGDGYVVTHGPSSFYGGGTPLFLVDEIEVSKDYANSLPIEDIERVEVFTGPSSAIYGSRAGVGVISIYTKSSMNRVRLEE